MPVLFLDCAADFSQVFPKGITRIRYTLLQVLRKLQLCSQRVAAFDRLRLLPFPLPDFVCYAKQFVDTLRNGKQTAIVVGEDDIAGFDQEGTDRADSNAEESRGSSRCGPEG